MGPLAGPVVGGAVVLEVGARIPGLNDSKLLTPDERERLDRIIRRRALAFSICAVDHAQVDRLGLIKARHLATAGAVAGLKIPAEYLLVDAWDVPEAPLPQMAVVRGDRTCASIMAASIVAKVARDKTITRVTPLPSTGRRSAVSGRAPFIGPRGRRFESSPPTSSGASRRESCGRAPQAARLRGRRSRLHRAQGRDRHRVPAWPGPGHRRGEDAYEHRLWNARGGGWHSQAESACSCSVRISIAGRLERTDPLRDRRPRDQT